MRRHVRRLAVITAVTATAAAAAPQASVAHHGGGSILAERSAPAIIVDTPRSEPVYRLGQRVWARYRCADPTGVVLCTGTVHSGHRIPTMVPGRHRLVITAMNRRGNVRTKVVTYRVRLLAIGPV